jgi:hypothetical protein
MRQGCHTIKNELVKIRDKDKIVSAGYGGEGEGAEWVVRRGWEQGGEMTQVLYAHMNNKKIKLFFLNELVKCRGLLLLGNMANCTRSHKHRICWYVS